MEITIALAGNPNAGKTSIFNGLTGSHQHVGNWPGVTVERKEGEFIHGNIKIKVVDLPGTYSLTPYTIDERIARDFIVKEKPELVVVIADASNLERNLYLLIEIMQLTKKTLLVLNMVDIAEKKGIKINHQSLSKILGIPVVKTIANKGVGIKELKDKIVEAIKNPQENVGEGSFLFNERIELAVSEIRDRVSKLRLIFPPRFIALKLLEKDDEIRELVFSKADNGLRTVVDAWIARLEKELGDDMASILAAEKYAFIHGLYNEVVELKSSVERQIDITDRVDRVLTNRYLGIPLFLFIMWIIFQLVFKVGNPLADIIDKLMGSLAALISEVLSKWGASSYAISFITDGIIGGVGSVLAFIPRIMLLFLAIAILEDSGYMARAAFGMDKLMHSLGLHGKSAIPMIVSFGCNIPGILATRTLKSEKDRILTI
ncbi:MAG: ferrous iron transport protein B, partial [Candidatus Hydrothermota bacterium]